MCADDGDAARRAPRKSSEPVSIKISEKDGKLVTSLSLSHSSFKSRPRGVAVFHCESENAVTEMGLSLLSGDSAHTGDEPVYMNL